MTNSLIMDSKEGSKDLFLKLKTNLILTLKRLAEGAGMSDGSLLGKGCGAAILLLLLLTMCIKKKYFLLAILFFFYSFLDNSCLISLLFKFLSRYFMNYKEDEKMSSYFNYFVYFYAHS